MNKFSKYEQITNNGTNINKYNKHQQISININRYEQISTNTKCNKKKMKDMTTPIRMNQNECTRLKDHKAECNFYT